MTEKQEASNNPQKSPKVEAQAVSTENHKRELSTTRSVSKTAEDKVNATNTSREIPKQIFGENVSFKVDIAKEIKKIVDNIPDNKSKE